MQTLEKKVFKYSYHGYKNINRLCLSKGARWPIVTIFIGMNSYIAFHFAPRHLISDDLEGHKRSYSLNLKQYAFSQLVFELVTSGKSKIMAVSMRRDFPRSPDSLPVT